MAGSQAIGFIFAIISATMNGSFTSVSKIKRVADADLDPIIFVSSLYELYHARPHDAPCVTLGGVALSLPCFQAGALSFRRPRSPPASLSPLIQMLRSTFHSLALLPAVAQNFYVCIGVFVSSWLVCPFLPIAGAPFSMAAPAIIAGAIFVFAVLFSFLAIPLVGIAIGQGEDTGGERCARALSRFPASSPPLCHTHTPARSQHRPYPLLFSPIRSHHARSTPNKPHPSSRMSPSHVRMLPGVWGAIAIIVSFLWGVIPGSKVAKPIAGAGPTAAALILLIVGAIGIVYVHSCMRT